MSSGGLDMNLVFWRQIAQYWIVRYSKDEREVTQQTINTFIDRVQDIAPSIKSTLDAALELIEEDDDGYY